MSNTITTIHGIVTAPKDIIDNLPKEVYNTKSFADGRSPKSWAILRDFCANHVTKIYIEVVNIGHRNSIYGEYFYRTKEN